MDEAMRAHLRETIAHIQQTAATDRLPPGVVMPRGIDVPFPLEIEGRNLAAQYRLLCDDLQVREENLALEKAALLDHLGDLPRDYVELYDAFKDLYHAVEAYLRIRDNGGDTALEVVAMRRCMQWAADDTGHWAYMAERLNGEVEDESTSGTLATALSG